jgi:hypothetical protein
MGERRLNRRTVSAIVLVLLVAGTLALAFKVQPVRAIGTINIRADGSVDPPNAPIQQDGNVHTSTNNNDSVVDPEVDVYRYNSKEPAPMGISDYGIGPSGPYEYLTKSFVGIVKIASLLTSGSTSGNSASFQLNVELEFNTSAGLRVYWIQSVAAVTALGDVLSLDDFDDNVWNFSEPSANMSASGVSGNGWISPLPQYPTLYFCTAVSVGVFSPTTLTTPTTMTLNVTSRVSSSGEPTVSVAFDIGYGWITYDTVTFTNVSELTSSPGFEVNGFNYTPAGYFYNAALILAGGANGGSTTDLQSDVQLRLEYWNGHNYEIVPNAYNFGSNTGEAVDNVTCGFSNDPENGTMFAEILPGAGQLGELYDQSLIGIIDITSPLTSGTLYVTDVSDPNATASQTPFVSGEVTVTLYPGYYDLQLYNQTGELFDQGNWEVSAGQTLSLQTPFKSGTHGVAVINITLSKTVFARGYPGNITVAVQNQGNFTENFNVTIYANTTSIASQNTTLTSGSSTNITFTWNTNALAYGNYTISAYASLVAGEMNTANNNCTVGCVIVTIPGDVNGDYAVNLVDLVVLAKAYGSKPGDTNWNPNANIHGNGLVGLLDLVILTKHYGQHYP